MAKTSEAQKRATIKWHNAHKDYLNELRRNRVLRLSVSFNNKKDKHYLEIWKSIPDKTEYMKSCLDEYEEKYGK